MKKSVARLCKSHLVLNLQGVSRDEAPSQYLYPRSRKRLLHRQQTVFHGTASSLDISHYSLRQNGRVGFHASCCEAVAMKSPMMRSIDSQIQ